MSGYGANNWSHTRGVGPWSLWCQQQGQAMVLAPVVGAGEAVSQLGRKQQCVSWAQLLWGMKHLKLSAAFHWDCSSQPMCLVLAADRGRQAVGIFNHAMWVDPIYVFLWYTGKLQVGLAVSGRCQAWAELSGGQRTCAGVWQGTVSL